MKPLIQEATAIDDRRYKISWLDPPFRHDHGRRR
jgi:hypothetical protein